VSPKAARRVPDQRAPSAADVQEAIALLHNQLAADMVEFRGLRQPCWLNGADMLGFSEERAVNPNPIVVL
jgi:hypothetical protein